VGAEIKGEDVRFKTALYGSIFKSIQANTLSLYTGLYGGFGDRKMMGLKLLWDYSYYWGVLSLLFFNNALLNIKMLRDINPLLQKAQRLNHQIQERFVARAKMRLTLENRGGFMDQYQTPCLHNFNNQLMRADGTQTMPQLKENIHSLEIISAAVLDMLGSDRIAHRNSAEADLLGDYRALIQS
ncbi:hypothetical protein OAF61_04535, partial [Pseudomonadales bacterium]|nr:hypothetical protein [Pseudomonadales bacterium]